MDAQGVGATHILRHTGMICQNGLLVCKKSVDMGHIFHENIPCYGSVFHSKSWKMLKISVFLWQKHKKWVPISVENV